jgi:hypothetical protein
MNPLLKAAHGCSSVLRGILGMLVLLIIGILTAIYILLYVILALYYFQPTSQCSHGAFRPSKSTSDL